MVSLINRVAVVKISIIAQETCRRSSARSVSLRSALLAWHFPKKIRLRRNLHQLTGDLHQTASRFLSAFPSIPVWRGLWWSPEMRAGSSMTTSKDCSPLKRGAFAHVAQTRIAVEVVDSRGLLYRVWHNIFKARQPLLPSVKAGLGNLLKHMKKSYKEIVLSSHEGFVSETTQSRIQVLCLFPTLLGMRSGSSNCHHPRHLKRRGREVSWEYCGWVSEYNCSRILHQLNPYYVQRAGAFLCVTKSDIS